MQPGWEEQEGRGNYRRPTHDDNEDNTGEPGQRLPVVQDQHHGENQHHLVEWGKEREGEDCTHEKCSEGGGEPGRIPVCFSISPRMNQESNHDEAAEDLS